MTQPKIGLALSGGGSRAMAFHLGCLRALHRHGVLDKVHVISTVSGGSVIGALYATTDGPFTAFEARVRAVLERGLFWPAVRVALTTSEGLKALFCVFCIGIANIALVIVSRAAWLLSFLAPPDKRKDWRLDGWHSPFRRFASRTTILRRAIDESLFKSAKLTDMLPSKPQLIINAAELRTGSAFYFSRKESGSWRRGKAACANIPIAHAVTASAAYPLLLPALDEDVAFNRKDGSRVVERVTLTDGGVYDNLGLAPLWPDRDPAVSLNVEQVDTIICCRAGYGLRHDPPSQFFISRLKSAFACVHDRAQNASMKRLFDLKEAGKLQKFLIPYLGQDDARLKVPPPDLVTREDAFAYPTDFSAMSRDWIDRLSRRGEQLTEALLAEHAPELTMGSSE